MVFLEHRIVFLGHRIVFLGHCLACEHARWFAGVIFACFVVSHSLMVTSQRRE